MTCLKCKHHEGKRFGFYGPRKIQRFRCPGCKATFSEPRPKPLGRHYLSTEKAAEIITFLLEGMSVRAVSRVTGAHQGTILSLLLTVGNTARNLFDARVRNIRPRFVQADELWTFVHTKDGHLNGDAPKEWGDQYIWMAIDSETKMVLSYLVGKRDAVNCLDFVRDLSGCVTGRFQITTDGLNIYRNAIEEYFGADVDFAQLLKLYGKGSTEGPEWYNPTKVVAAVPVPVSGNPELEHISTSHVERANLSVRTHLRRFTRLSLGFSKTLEHLTPAIHLYMAFFNFCRVHQTLRVTPAMQAGIADHVWSVQELLTWSAE
ncbi:MAG TPA: IS1 family transposase [Candidatus Acidoferrales bacterium]|nr:IS1 family transposase [Candidatus Acidoferrales bacterium]